MVITLFGCLDIDNVVRPRSAAKVVYYLFPTSIRIDSGPVFPTFGAQWCNAAFPRFSGQRKRNTPRKLPLINFPLTRTFRFHGGAIKRRRGKLIKYIYSEGAIKLAQSAPKRISL